MGRLVLVGGDCIAPLAGLSVVRILPITVTATIRIITVRFIARISLDLCPTLEVRHQHLTKTRQ